ncbi:MFS transporter [Streptomyces griseorubiginosus]|uniref:MFS transporter n=1 Tax=Streptomyces griseorubiginosus TaxID=67304 RepID=UPI00076CE51B|nr:MFS transporter [Streptomyces griseorubiginosus]KUM76603.1 MFS transporter [Streptomyces griseorubiginosus]
MSTTLTESPPAGAQPYPRRWAAAAVMMIAALMDLLDVTIVNVAIPSVGRDLQASQSDLQWLVSAYLLGFAATLIVSGHLGDRFGRRGLFLAGVAGFGLASLACGSAQTPGQLIAARAVQGVTAAVLVPQVLGAFRTMFHGKERGAAFGMYGAVAGFASAIGLLAGGLLTDADLFGWGWRSVFLVNVPVAVGTFVAGLALVPATKERSAGRPDVLGSLLLAGGLVAVVLPLVQGRENGWPVWGWVCMAGGVCAVVGLGVFEARRGSRRGMRGAAAERGTEGRTAEGCVTAERAGEGRVTAGRTAERGAAERRTAERGAAEQGGVAERGAAERRTAVERPGIVPLLPARAFRLPAFSVGVLVQLLFSVGMQGFFLVFALWLQGGQGYTPLQAGVLTVAFSAGAFLTAPVADGLAVRFGRLVLGAGALLMAGGFGWVWSGVDSAAAVHTGAWPLVPGLVLAGAGLGLLAVPLVNVVLSAVPGELAGGASGIFSTAQQFGGAVGAGIVGTVFFSHADEGPGAALGAAMPWVVGGFVVSAALCGVLPRRGRGEV